MEFFSHKKEFDQKTQIGFKKGELVRIYRPTEYKGPSLTIFHYKGYVAEIAENENYLSNDIYIKITGKNSISTIKVNKYFLKRIDNDRN